MWVRGVVERDGTWVRGESIVWVCTEAEMTDVGWGSRIYLEEK